MTASGPPDEVTERLLAFVDAGGEHLVVLPCSRVAAGIAERVFAEVVARLQRPGRPPDQPWG